MNVLFLSVMLLILPNQEYDVVNAEGKNVFPDAPKEKIPGSTNNYFLVVNDGIRPLREPKADSKFSGAPPIKFCEKSFLLLDGYQGQYWLACRKENGKLIIHGWIPDDSVLFNEDAIFTQTSGVTRKALIINTKDWITKNGNKLPVPVLGFLNNSVKREPIRFFNIMFVFKEIKSKNPEIGHQFLLGFDPNIANSETASVVLAGWIPANALCQWDTRQAIQWNDDNMKVGIKDPRENPGKIFKTKEDLEKFCSPKENLKSAKNDPVGLLASEIVDSNGNSVPWKIDQPRYPILSMEQQQIVLGEGFGSALKIGLIGSFQRDDGKFVDADEVNKQRDLGIQIKAGMEQTYILFVIDDTASMEPAFNDVVPKCIENVIKTVKDPTKVNIAVCFYNDFKSNEEKNKKGASLDDTFEFLPWTPLTDGLKTPIIDVLKKHQTKDGGDALEQPIHGLLRGLEKASIDIPRHARKIVFVIGDMGNHVSDNLKQDIAKDSQKIAELLTRGNDSPWEFLPLQVPHPRGGQAARDDDDYKLYAKQMDNIHKLVRERREEAIKKIDDSVLKAQIKLQDIGSTIAVENYEAMLKELNSRTSLYEDKKKNIIAELQEIVRGTFPPGSKFSSEVSEAFSNENVNVKLLSEGGFQIFEEGWVSSHDGASKSKPQIKTMLFMEHKVFSSIENFLKKIKESYKKNDLDDLGIKVAKGITGDMYRNPEDALKSTEGIKFNSKLLNLIRERMLLKEQKQDLKPSDIVEHMKRLSKMALIFEDVLNNQIAEYMEIQKELPGGEPVPDWARVKNSLVEKVRFFQLLGSIGNKEVPIKFIWLDNETELP